MNKFTILCTILLVFIINNTLSIPHDNPQQKICARPPKKCTSQKKLQSCVNWHGCKWINFNAGAGKFCRNDDNCVTKATVVPTPAPIDGPTKKPTMKPTTGSPTSACEKPPVACSKIKKASSCRAWTGCQYKNKKCRSRDCSNEGEGGDGEGK